MEVVIGTPQRGPYHLALRQANPGTLFTGAQDLTTTPLFRCLLPQPTSLFVLSFVLQAFTLSNGYPITHSWLRSKVPSASLFLHSKISIHSLMHALADQT